MRHLETDDHTRTPSIWRAAKYAIAPLLSSTTSTEISLISFKNSKLACGKALRLASGINSLFKNIWYTHVLRFPSSTIFLSPFLKIITLSPGNTVFMLTIFVAKCKTFSWCSIYSLMSFCDGDIFILNLGFSSSKCNSSGETVSVLNILIPLIKYIMNYILDSQINLV